MNARTVVFFAILGLLAGQDRQRAVELRKQGVADLNAGRYPAAIAKQTEAATLFHKAGDRDNESEALTSVGLAQLFQGDYSAARGTFAGCLQISREIRDREGEISLLNNIGTTYYYQGRYAEAMEQYEQALERVQASPGEKWTASRRQVTIANIAILHQTLGQYELALAPYTELLNAKQALRPEEQAQLLANVGALRRRLGDPQKALDTYRAAQALYRQAAHRDGEIGVLNNIGILQAMELADYPAAAATFTASLELCEQSGNRPRAVHAHLYRGETLYRARRFTQSAADFQHASNDAGALGKIEEHWKALYGLARIAIGSGDAGRAKQLLTDAVGLIESMRAGLGTSSLRSDFLGDKRDVFDLLIEHAATPQEAFRWMEQSRARNLRDRVGAAPQRDLESISKQLAPGTAVLEYWMGADQGAALWITAAGSGMRRFALTKEDREAINSLPSALADPKNQTWRETAARAAAKLIAATPPLADPGVRHVVIIPDGVLGRVPYEALPLDGATLLVERSSVSYSPSAALITSSKEHPRAMRWPWQETLNAFGDPAPGPGDRGVDLEASRAWPRLPGAVREVEGIAGIVGGRPALHVGAAAQKMFLNQTPRAPVLHFATHAFADMQDPDRSYILLAPASASQRFDYLFLREVYDLPLAGTDLATISACQTDAGKVVRGEGVESFSRAFLAAGARAVVTSLWSVGDRQTAEVMLRFYKQLAGGETVAGGLRETKLEFLRNRATSHPAYWAAFVVHGEETARIPRVIGWAWFGAPLAVLALSAGALFRMRAGKASR